MNKIAGVNIGIALFSIAFIIMGYLAVKDINLMLNGAKTEGVVSQLIRKHDPNYRLISRVYYIPVISFFAADGAEFQTWGCPDCYQIGDKVPVVYDSKNPAIAEVDSWALYEPLYYVIGFALFIVLFVRLRTNIKKLS